MCLGGAILQEYGCRAAPTLPGARRGAMCDVQQRLTGSVELQRLAACQSVADIPLSVPHELIPELQLCRRRLQTPSLRVRELRVRELLCVWCLRFALTSVYQSPAPAAGLSSSSVGHRSSLLASVTPLRPSVQSDAMASLMAGTVRHFVPSQAARGGGGGAVSPAADRLRVRGVCLNLQPPRCAPR